MADRDRKLGLMFSIFGLEEREKSRYVVQIRLKLRGKIRRGSILNKGYPFAKRVRTFSEYLT